MVMRKMVKFINDSDFPIVSLSFGASATSFTLKLCAFVKLLDLIPMAHYPLLIFGLGLMVFALELLRPAKKYKSASNIIFYSLIAAVVINIVSFHPFFNNLSFKSNGWIFSDFVFLSGFGISFVIDHSLSSLIGHTTTKIKNENIHDHIFYARTGGYLVAAVYMLLMVTAKSYLYPLAFSIAPAVISMIMIYYVNKVRTDVEENFENVNNIEEQLNKTTEFSRDNYPFLHLVIGLTFLSTLVFLIQDFIAFIGLYELKESLKISSAVLYSSFAIAISFVSMIVYAGHDFISKRNSTWSTYFKNHFIFSSITLFISFVKLSPLFLLFSGATSHIIRTGLYAKSSKHFLNNFPKFVQERVETVFGAYTTIASYAVSSILFYATLKGWLPMKYLWLLGSFIALAGLYIRHELKRNFADYHVGNLVRGDIYDALECCERLATPEAKERYAAMVSILNQSPRPILAKALLKTLGSIEAPKVVPDLMSFYTDSDRDDIKLGALKALACYESHHINLFLLECLEDIIESDTFQSDSKKEIFSVISTKLEGIAVPMLLKMLKNNPQHFRIISNCIMAVGEIAVSTNDDSLFYLLSQYLNPIYTRRIRCNAAIFLYRTRKYKEMASATMSALLTSDNEHDRSAVAYMAGELKVYTMTPFILESSIRADHKSVTLLISLLKLEYYKASELIVELIGSSNNDEVKVVFNQINMIKQAHDRYKIYYEIMQYNPEKISQLLEHMSLSGKNFDNDRILIRSEAIKLGCHVEKDENLFLKDDTLLKAA
ncbi:MAG: hypothetical protein ACI9QD_000081 [Thermoproteota archaeon]|jgi:hypothetical protein